VRLFAALEAGFEGSYQVAKDELRLDDFDFFRLLGSDGELIDPPAGSRADAGLFAPFIQERLKQQLAPAKPQESTSAGYITIQHDDSEPARIYRVLSAPIRNFETTVGALVFGQQMQDFEKAADAKLELERGMQAMWLDGKLIGSTFPSEITADMESELGASIGAERPLNVGRMLRIGSVGYRYMAHCLNPNSPFPPAYYVSIVSLAGFEFQQRTLIFKIVALGLVAILLASFVGFIFAKQITQPIRSLVSATHDIQQGNFQPAITPGPTQEMQHLADAFQDMAAGLALKDRYHSVLSMVADQRVAEQLMAGKIPLGGELRDVTIIFCDIRGYTALSAGRDPREVIELLNKHMSALTRVVYRHHGVINQFAGDAIMILFGAPMDNPTHAADAVLCAQEMLAERERLNELTHEPLGIGFGIATGKVVAGCLGAENRADYTAVGDRVNLAARLCSVAAAGEIVIDDQTRAALPESTPSTPTEPLKLKGFSDPIIAHLLMP
jgi:class 3 adenylate cyclase